MTLFFYLFTTLVRLVAERKRGANRIPLDGEARLFSRSNNCRYTRQLCPKLHPAEKNYSSFMTKNTV